MRIIFGLLFLAWGSSIIFDFDFNFWSYLFPLIIIGIGIDILFKDNEFYQRCKRDRKSEKWARKKEKYERKMEDLNAKKEEETHE